MLLLPAMVGVSCWAGDYKKVENIPFKDGVEKCVLDVSYKPGVKKVPVIVWFHGGGLTGGEKYTPEELLTDDYVVVSVGYRLYPEVSVAEIIDDAAAAVAWVDKNISKYGGAVDKIVLTGHSAGGYLVAMLALDKRYLGKYGIDPDKYPLVAPLSGQMMTHFTERESRGIEKTRPVVDSLAPLNLIRPDCPPLLLVTGDREQELICRYEENALFCALMKHIGHPSVELYELKGYDHGSMASPGMTLLMGKIKDLK